MKNYIERDPSDDEVNNFFLGGNKFRVNSLDNVLDAAHRGNKLIQQHATNSLQKARRCHVGKESIRVDESFVVTLPPKNKQVTQVFNKLVEAGIQQRWSQESRATALFKRVQDRVKFVSITNIKEVEDNLPVALKVGGKTLTIFLLGGICIFLPTVAFAVELAIKRVAWTSVQDLSN